MTKSLLTRLYHRIVAKRIEALCPCSERQKAFRRGDRIAENLFLCGPAYPRSHSAEDAEAALLRCYESIRLCVSAAWTRADWTEVTWGPELQYQATLEKDQDLRRVIITRNNFPYLTVPQELQDTADKLFNDGSWKKTRGRQNVIHLRPAKQHHFHQPNGRRRQDILKTASAIQGPQQPHRHPN